MSFLNVTDNSFIPVNNSKHKRKNNNDLTVNESKPMNICSDQNKERTHSINSDQELSNEQQKRNQTSYTNREFSGKKQLFIRNLHIDTTEENLYKLFGLR